MGVVGRMHVEPSGEAIISCVNDGFIYFGAKSPAIPLTTFDSTVHDAELPYCVQEAGRE